jgi:aspartate ammonia-lyase
MVGLAAADTRQERDLLGSREVSSQAYYGIQTLRGMENFHISGVPLSHYPELITALAMIKMAAARANRECGHLSAPIAHGIEEACVEIIGGQWHDQFQLDLFQGGAGTSTNMNANEVIANRALELLGKTKGEYGYCDPHDHVNASQSTNDAYPSALHVALALGNRKLIRELRRLAGALQTKAKEFNHIVKIGRTQLQDAVPMTLGQEFEAFARSLDDEINMLQRVESALHEVNMGGTAIGTGLNAPAGFAERCTAHLATITEMPIRLAENLVEATQDTQAFVLYSSALKSLSIKASKICNDLRLLASGPRAGLHEINLPAMQPGSSIMPGKVNPVIPEVVNQVCYRIIGNDLTVTMAAEAGQLQLNVMEPVIAACLLEGQTLLFNAARTLREKCVNGITANEDACQSLLERSIGTVTALNPVIGYEKASELAAEALRTGKGIIELVREKKILTEEQLARTLDPAAMTLSRRRA